jgi:hypothetical protein
MSVDPLAIRDKMKLWLEDDGYPVRIIEDKRTYFTLGVEHPTLHLPFTIGQRLGQKDRINILGTLKVSDEHKQQLKRMGEDELSNFIWMLELTLLTNDVQFEMSFSNHILTQPSKPVQVPDQIIIAEAIWHDGLIKDNLMRRIRQTVKGMQLSLLKLDMMLGTQTLKEQHSRYHT